MRYEIKHHKGRSGRSAFEWRVYSVWDHNGRARRHQLAKYRTEAAAQRCLEHFQAVDARREAIRKECERPMPYGC